MKKRTRALALAIATITTTALFPANLASGIELADPSVEADDPATGWADARSILISLDPASPHRAHELLSELQANQLGTAVGPAVPPAGYERPSQALKALAERHGLHPSEAELQPIASLDELPEELRSALSRVVDAYISLEIATELAFQGASSAELVAARDRAEHSLLRTSGDWTEAAGPRLADGFPAWATGMGDSSSGLASHGIDLSTILSTRSQLLAEVGELKETVASSAWTPRSSCEPVELAPAFSIDLDGCDTVRRAAFALSIDLGGNDVYQNNAGGNSLAADGCTSVPQGEAGAAALIDLGEGADLYGDPADPPRCGSNGGARWGVGFLFDGGGDDRYMAGPSGANGGGELGVGFLMDLGGDDWYNATFSATNGGGDYGSGFLLDVAGDDTYNATFLGTNGGAFVGAGLLLDLDGHDGYNATGGGTNGGGIDGNGLLYDATGDDVYIALDGATNGGAFLGSGLLFDRRGDDMYNATHTAVNGGGVLGVGTLLDTDGTDSYSDDEGGTGQDRTVLLKEGFGAQIDLDI